MGVQDALQIGCFNVLDLEIEEPCVFSAPAFASLTELYLNANEVHAFIDAPLRLRALHITAEELRVTSLNLLLDMPGQVALEATC